MLPVSIMFITVYGIYKFVWLAVDGKIFRALLMLFIALGILGWYQHHVHEERNQVKQPTDCQENPYVEDCVRIRK